MASCKMHVAKAGALICWALFISGCSSRGDHSGTESKVSENENHPEDVPEWNAAKRHDRLQGCKALEAEGKKVEADNCVKEIPVDGDWNQYSSK